MAADEPSELRRGQPPRGAGDSTAELFAPLSRALAEASSRRDPEAVRRAQDELHATLHARLSPGLGRHFQRKLLRQGGTGLNPRAVGDRADELVQRTWIAFWEALRKGKYDPAKAGLSTFLYAVSHIVWMRFHRELSRSAQAGGFELHEVSHPAEDAGSAGELAEQVHAVRALLAANPTQSPPAESAGGDVPVLSVEERHLLRAISQGRTDRELAAELGTSPSTAHARKKAALARLARVLAKLGMVTEGGSEGTRPPPSPPPTPPPSPPVGRAPPADRA